MHSDPAYKWHLWSETYEIKTLKHWFSLQDCKFIHTPFNSSLQVLKIYPYYLQLCLQNMSVSIKLSGIYIISEHLKTVSLCYHGSIDFCFIVCVKECFGCHSSHLFLMLKITLESFIAFDQKQIYIYINKYIFSWKHAQNTHMMCTLCKYLNQVCACWLITFFITISVLFLSQPVGQKARKIKVKFTLQIPLWQQGRGQQQALH